MAYINTPIEKVIDDGMMVYANYLVKNRALCSLYSGLKPIHSKILWSMWENKTTQLTKSATVEGRVMKYSPHGGCYDTIVNLIQKDRFSYNLLKGQGNFARFTSNEIHYAAQRYTECSLSSLGIDCMQGINKNMVDMIPNYDNTALMPREIPVRFPNVLCMANTGMAVGMASDMPSFNLREICNETIKYLNGEEYVNLIPDFPTKGKIFLNDKEIEKINNTGFGTVKLRGKAKIKDNLIIITEIPYHKKVFEETIINKIIELVRDGKLKEISRVDNLTGKDGIEIEVEAKKGTNMNSLLNKLYALTPLETTFSCNMNVLKDKTPMVLGVKNIIKEWCIWREECIKRGLQFDLNKISKKLHLLKGLRKVLLDTDKAIEIIKNANEDSFINKSLMNYFSIDEEQAEMVGNLKLRNINKNYIINQIKVIEDLEAQINDLEFKINNKQELDKIIISDLEEISKKYGKDRQTEIIQESEIQDISKEELIEDYNCRVILTQEGYIKKHSKQSDNHKLKENDIILQDFTTTNKSTLLLLTNKVNRYKLPAYELDLLIPSNYGQYIPNIIQLEPNEKVIKVVSITDPTKGYIYTAYSNGKLGKVDIKSFMSNNKKLQNCYNTDSELLDITYSEKDIDVIMVSSEGKSIIFNTSKINSKQSRNTQGVTAMKLADGLCVVNAKLDVDKDYKIQLETSSNKQKEVYLNDVVSSTDDREMYKYLSLKHGNQGNFIWNMRSYKDDKITKVTFIK